MVSLDLGKVEERLRPSLAVGRYLYVGLGEFGRTVVQRVADSLRDAQGTLPPLTHITVVDASSLAFEAGANADRRELQQAFVQPAVTGPLRNTFYDGIEHCAAMLPMGEMPPNVSSLIHVHIVADLAEAFGSAVVRDVASLLHDVAGPRPHTVFGFLRFSPRPDQRARAFATLRELAADLRCVADAPPTRFDRCFLLGKANRQGELDGAQQIALAARLLVRFQRADLSGIETAVGDPTADECCRLASAGLASAYFPRRELQRYCVRRWCQEVCQLLIAVPRGGLEAEGAASKADLGDVQLGAANDVYRALEQQVHAAGVPAPQLPQVRTGSLDGPALAQSLRAAWQRLPQSCAEACRRITPSVPLRSQRTRLESAITHLVQINVGGIARAQRRLEHLCQAAQTRSDEVGEQHKRIGSDAEHAAAEIEERLSAAAGNPPCSSLRQPAPPWYNLVRRWQRWRDIRRARVGLAAWHKATCEHIDSYRELLVQKAIWEAAAQAYREFGSAAAAEQARLQRLIEELASVASVIAQKQRAEGPQALVVDRNILPSDAYEAFYRRLTISRKCEVTRDTVAAILETEELLTGYRELTADQIAARLMANAQERFQAIGDMTLSELLDTAGLTPRYLALSAWLSHDLWDYAEPLTKLHHLARPDLEQLRAEFSALQVPDLESLACPPDPWPYGPNGPTVISGSDCSVHLCRVLQGFSLAALDELDLCREAYHALADRGPLHTVDKPHELPDTAS
jgi:hypothetical protein